MSEDTKAEDAKMGIVEAIGAIMTVVGLGTKLVVDLTAKRLTPEQAVGNMVDGVMEFVASVSEGGSFDQKLAARRAKFDADMAAIDKAKGAPSPDAVKVEP